MSCITSKLSHEIVPMMISLLVIVRFNDPAKSDGYETINIRSRPERQHGTTTTTTRYQKRNCGNKPKDLKNT